MPADTKQKAEDGIAAVRKALDGTDIDAIKSASEQLQTAAQDLAQVVYSATDAQTAQGAPTDGGSADDVVDADYEVVDDDNKQN